LSSVQLHSAASIVAYTTSSSPSSRVTTISCSRSRWSTADAESRTVATSDQRATTEDAAADASASVSSCVFVAAPSDVMTPAARSAALLETTLLVHEEREVSVLLCTVTYSANRAHSLTRSP
jgi:hypothetical protein